MGYIYCIENVLDNKKYIGQTIRNPGDRKCEHWWHLAKQDHKNKKLQSAVNKYGLKNFTFFIIEEIENSLLNEREQYWIKFYHTFFEDKECWGYNLTVGGEGAPTGGVKVYQYDSNGNFIQEFESYSAAGRAMGLTPQSIRNQCIYPNRRISTSKIDKKRYLFSLEKTDKIILEDSIIQLDKDGNIINIYFNQSQIKEKFGARDNNQRLGIAIKEKRLYWGFYWIYVKDYNGDNHA